MREVSRHVVGCGVSFVHRRGAGESMAAGVVRGVDFENFFPLKIERSRLYFAFPRRGESEVLLFENRVCDRAMALVDPLFS